MTVKQSKTAATAPPFDDSLPVAVAVEVPSSVPVATPAAAANSVTTTTTTTRVVHPLSGLPSAPLRTKCPFCDQTMVTRVKEEISGCTIALVVILLICFWPLFWLPLVCRDVSILNRGIFSLLFLY